MLQLARAMDRLGIDFIWYILTNDKFVISHPNIVFIDPRLDTYKWIDKADYVCLLSDSEACSYTLNEALYRNIPIITTPLPYLNEIGIKDGDNAYIMQFDCSNVADIVKRIKKVPKFEFNRMEDNYSNLFKDSKSHYEEDLKMNVKVRCIQNYYDIETDERKVFSLDVSYDEPKKHPNRVEWITTRERAEHLQNKGLVKIVEFIEEDKKENKKKPLPKKTEKR